jgi:hypothetical protein
LGDYISDPLLAFRAGVGEAGRHRCVFAALLVVHGVGSRVGFSAVAHPFRVLICSSSSRRRSRARRRISACRRARRSPRRLRDLPHRTTYRVSRDPLISIALGSATIQITRYARLLMRIKAHHFTSSFCQQSLATPVLSYSGSGVSSSSISTTFLSHASQISALPGGAASQPHRRPLSHSARGLSATQLSHAPHIQTAPVAPSCIVSPASAPRVHSTRHPSPHSCACEHYLFYVSGPYVEDDPLHLGYCLATAPARESGGGGRCHRTLRAPRHGRAILKPAPPAPSKVMRKL